ncbi:MAG TPA: hypothetical protein PLK28_15570 [Candidatus Rifleibacterium sp.]|nr:hypothetical protein [Candidatus Rifleibacterium sp.]
MMNRRKAFSFAELIIAIMVLSAGILPIFWFFSRTNIGTIKTRDEILAWQYASELLDVAVARGYAANPATGEKGIEIDSISCGDLTTSVDKRFSRRLFVKDLAPGHNSEWPCRYKTISVEVSWIVDTQPRSMRLTGLIYAPEN